MGYDLYSKSGDETRWTQTFWPRLLALAEKNGWQPKGTSAPKDYKETWDGSYWYNSGEIVAEEDAANLATALEKALPTLPEKEITIPKAEFATDPSTRLPRIANWDNIPLEHFFSGPFGRKSIEEFIAFCRKGSFEIS
jgi:hypothetical protein